MVQARGSGLEAKRGIALLAAAFVVSPLALGIGIILLIAASGDDKGAGGGDFELSAGMLRVGKGYVPAEYAGLIEKAAADCDQGLPAGILAAQLQAESNFNPRAQSKDPATGRPIADGIAQFIPTTWASSGIDGNGDGKKDVWDPEDAIPSQGKMMCALLRTAKKHPGYNGSRSSSPWPGTTRDGAASTSSKGFRPSPSRRGRPTTTSSPSWPPRPS